MLAHRGAGRRAAPAEFAQTLRLCTRPDHTLREVKARRPADGIDLTQRLKNTPGLAAIPVVMFTGESRMETLLRSMEEGAADFLVKPFTREALVAKLSKYLPIPA